MPNTIQSRVSIVMDSRDSGMDGTLYNRSQPPWQPQCLVPHWERRQGGAELELARQRLERQQPGVVFRNSLHFSLAFAGEFCFRICPCQPPRFSPISSNFSDNWMYFPISNDSVSQRINNKILIETLSSGIDFLGWVHFPGYRVLRTATKRRMLRLIHARVDPKVTTACHGLLSHGNTHKLSMVASARWDWQSWNYQ